MGNDIVRKITKIAALIVIVVALIFMLAGRLNKLRNMVADMPKSSEISTAENAASSNDDKSDGFINGFIYSQLINHALK